MVGMSVSLSVCYILVHTMKRSSRNSVCDSGVGKIHNFQEINRRCNLETTLLLMTNRKSHILFDWFQINDLGWPWTANIHTITENMRLSEPNIKKLNEDRPHYQQHKCSSMTLLSGDIRSMRIFAGVPWEGGVKRQWVVDIGNFQHFCWLFLQTL